MTLYNVHQAKTQLSKLLQLAEQGQEVIIARDGKPVARLSKYVGNNFPVRRFGQLEGLMTEAEIDALLAPDQEIIDAFDEAILKPLDIPRRAGPDIE